MANLGVSIRETSGMSEYISEQIIKEKLPELQFYAEIVDLLLEKNFVSGNKINSLRREKKGDFAILQVLYNESKTNDQLFREFEEYLGDNKEKLFQLLAINETNSKR